MSGFQKQYSITGDVDEVFYRIAEENKYTSAYCWYWYQCCIGIYRYFSSKLYWSAMMIRNYIKIALRNIVRHKVYYLLNISGLGLGLAFFIMTQLYASYEYSVNTFHKNADRIYSLVKVEPSANNIEKHSSLMPPPILPAILRDIPEVESGSRYRPAGRKIVQSNDKTFYESGVVVVDPAFLSIFSFKMIEGDPSNVLSDPYSAVISVKTAKKYFGDSDPLGQFLTFDNRMDVKITGIIEDEPLNSNITYSFLLSYATIESSENISEDWTSETNMTFLLLRDKNDRMQLDDKLHSYAEKFNASERRLYLFPLLDIYLYSRHISSFVYTSTTMPIYTFYSISFVLLLIACFNFINLATAKSMTRAREIGVRLAVGAHRSQLIKQLLSESIVIALLAVPVSMIIYETAILKYFARIFGGLFDYFSLLNSGGILLYIILVAIIVGIMAGMYPAFLVSRYQAVQVLKSSVVSGKGGMRIRRILIVSQLVVSIVAIVMTLMVREQRDYILKYDLGYDRHDRIALRINDQIIPDYPVLRDKLVSYSEVTGVSAAAGLSANWKTENLVVPEGKDENEAVVMNTYAVNYDFIETLDMKILDGRSFSQSFHDENSFLINEKAVGALEWKYPIGKEVAFAGKRGQIVGIVKDFHFKDLYWDILPSLIYITSDNLNYIYITLSHTVTPDALGHIETAWKECFPNLPFEYLDLNDAFLDTNSELTDIEEVFALIGYIAVFYSLMGIIGLSLYSVERRTKEIGIRKVLGATSGKILTKLYSEYLVLIILSNIIAAPIAYFITTAFLDFAWTFTTDIKLWLFAVIAVIMMLAVILSVFYQTLKAANANPVDSLRYE
ncbi:ABC transporter permease [candidate division KSB1 bacterium]